MENPSEAKPKSSASNGLEKSFLQIKDILHMHKSRILKNSEEAKFRFLLSHAISILQKEDPSLNHFVCEAMSSVSRFTLCHLVSKKTNQIIATPSGFLQKVTKLMEELSEEPISCCRKPHGYLTTKEIKNQESVVFPECYCVKQREFTSIVYEPVNLKHKENVKFQLVNFGQGFVIQFTTTESFSKLEFEHRFYNSVIDDFQWLQNIHCSSIVGLNDAMDYPSTRELDLQNNWKTKSLKVPRPIPLSALNLVWLSEARYQRNLANIADSLSDNLNRRGIRVILICGPSASGKTTTARRIQMELTILGHTSQSISMDDFYHDREYLQKAGIDSFEVIESLNYSMLSKRVAAILNKEQVPKRKFNFLTGTGFDEKSSYDTSTDFLIIEGINALEHRFIANIMKHGVLYTGIFIAPMTTFSLTNCNRVQSRDIRLLRRILRDAQTRGYSASQTLARWPDVLQYERDHLFNFQSAADHWVNTFMVYELALYRTTTLNLLQNVTPGLFQSEIERLITLLGGVAPLDPAAVPRNSVIREFLGDVFEG